MWGWNENDLRTKYTGAHWVSFALACGCVWLAASCSALTSPQWRIAPQNGEMGQNLSPLTCSLSVLVSLLCFNHSVRNETQVSTKQLNWNNDQVNKKGSPQTPWTWWPLKSSKLHPYLWGESPSWNRTLAQLVTLPKEKASISWS